MNVLPRAADRVISLGKPWLYPIPLSTPDSIVRKVLTSFPRTRIAPGVYTKTLDTSRRGKKVLHSRCDRNEGAYGGGGGGEGEPA